MVWRTEFDPDALEELKKFDQATQRRIIAYLRERIATPEDPRRFGKALRGDLTNLWRYRIGDFRLICDIQSSHLLVLVLRVGHRKDVYTQR